MISNSLLLDNGYKCHGHEEGQNPWLNQADKLYQKRIKNAKGDTLYFIDIFYYDHRRYHHPNLIEGWMPEAQFNTKTLGESKDAFCFNVRMIISEETSLKQIESFFQNIYKKMDCKPYELAGE